MATTGMWLTLVPMMWSIAITGGIKGLPNGFSQMLAGWANGFATLICCGNRGACCGRGENKKSSRRSSTASGSTTSVLTEEEYSDGLRVDYYSYNLLTYFVFAVFGWTFGGLCVNDNPDFAAVWFAIASLNSVMFLVTAAIGWGDEKRGFKEVQSYSVFPFSKALDLALLYGVFHHHTRDADILELYPTPNYTRSTLQEETVIDIHNTVDSWLFFGVASLVFSALMIIEKESMDYYISHFFFGLGTAFWNIVAFNILLMRLWAFDSVGALIPQKTVHGVQAGIYGGFILFYFLLMGTFSWGFRYAPGMEDAKRPTGRMVTLKDLQASVADMGRRIDQLASVIATNNNSNRKLGY